MNWQLKSALAMGVLWTLGVLLLGGCAEPVADAASGKKSSDSSSTADAQPKANPSIDKDDFMADFPLIPREVLFGNPRRAQARISPDGKWLAFRAPVDGFLNVWVAPVDTPRSCRGCDRGQDSRDLQLQLGLRQSAHSLFSRRGPEMRNWHLYATDVETKETKDLTPIEGVHARIQNVSDKFPGEILVSLNDRVPQLHDIWKVNLQTGEKELVQENHGVAGYLTDDDYNVRIAYNYTPEGGQVWQKRSEEDADQPWQDFVTVGPEDAMTTGPAGFDKTGQTLYFEDSRDRNTAALFAMDLATGQVDLVARGCAVRCWRHPGAPDGEKYSGGVVHLRASRMEDSRRCHSARS